MPEKYFGLLVWFRPKSEWIFFSICFVLNIHYCKWTITPRKLMCAIQSSIQNILIFNFVMLSDNQSSKLSGIQGSFLEHWGLSTHLSSGITEVLTGKQGIRCL